MLNYSGKELGFKLGGGLDDRVIIGGATPTSEDVVADCVAFDSIHLLDVVEAPVCALGVGGAEDALLRLWELTEGRHWYCGEARYLEKRCAYLIPITPRFRAGRTIKTSGNCEVGVCCVVEAEQQLRSRGVI